MKGKNAILQFTFLMLACLFAMKTNAQNLIDHQWENRVLVIQASAENNPKYIEQVKAFKNLEAELKDRKILTYHILNGQYKLIGDQSKPWKECSGDLKRISASKDAFKIILIGLDGGVKLEQSNMLSPSKLFDLIDSMPMRRYEVKHKN